jgi:hypothetical protein
MEVQVFIKGKKTLLRDSLSRAICRVCTTLSTVFVDKARAELLALSARRAALWLVEFF